MQVTAVPHHSWSCLFQSPACLSLQGLSFSPLPSWAASPAGAAPDLARALHAPGPQADLAELKLSVAAFGTKFDVVLVDPPWEEYARRAPGAELPVWPWQDIMRLEIEAIVDTPSFLFLWCASVASACAAG